MKPLKLKRNRDVSASPLSPWDQRAAMVTGVFVLVLLVVLAWVYWLNWARYARAQDQIDSRIARIDGILASSADIDARLAQAKKAVGPWLHKGGADAQNEVTQRLRELVVSSGATLVSSQAAALPAESEQQLARINVSATVTGEWSQLFQLAQALQSQRPPFLARSLNIQREGQVSGKTSQKARLTVQLEAPLAVQQGAKP